MKSTTRSSTAGLKELKRALELIQAKRVQVGIFAAKTSRPDGDMTNADIGAINEYGVPFAFKLGHSQGIPARSWLRMPINLKGKEIFSKAAKKAGELVSASSKAVAGRVDLFYRRIGIAAEVAIHQAFRSQGFGTWAPNAASTIKRKGSASPLIDHRELERSVASRVV